MPHIFNYVFKEIDNITFIVSNSNSHTTTPSTPTERLNAT